MRRSQSSSRAAQEEPIDVDAIPTPPPVPAAAIQQLRDMIGASEARCRDLLLGADMDVERAINHHFEAQEINHHSAAPSASASSSSSGSVRPKAKPAPAAKLPAPKAKAQGSLLVRKRPLPSLAPAGSLQSAALSTPAAAAAAASSTSSGSSSNGSGSATPTPLPSFVSASALMDEDTPTRRSRPSRAAAPTSFKKKKKEKKGRSSSASSGSSKTKTKAGKKRRRNDSDESDSSSEDDDEEEEEEDEEASGSDAEAAVAVSESDASSAKSWGDSSDSDSDDGGFMRRLMLGGMFNRRAPAAGARRRRGGAAADDDGAPAARRRRVGGAAARGGRAGRGGRASAAALKRDNFAIIVPGQKEEDDKDAERLSKVVTWLAPPPPLNLVAAGVQFSDRWSDRARWRVGQLIDCNLVDDGRGWARAKIVNIVAAPRTFAISVDVCFEGRRADVLPDARFRFGITDGMHLQPLNMGSEPKFEERDGEPERARELAAQRAKAGAKKNNNKNATDGAVAINFLAKDFSVHQLVDVRVGSRWFLGQVTRNQFLHIGESFEDVIDVLLVDFHRDCTRRYTSASLSRLHPVAHSHPITHYPLHALPPPRDKELSVASIYASNKPGYLWSDGGRVADADEGEEEKKKEADDAVALVDGEGEAIAPASAAAAAAAAPAAASAAAAAAAAPIPPPMLPTRPLGRFSLTVVSDVDFNDNKLKPMEVVAARERFAERCMPLLADDPCRGGRKMSEETALQRLRLLMQFAGVGPEYSSCTLIAEPVQIGVVGNDEDHENRAAGRFRKVALHSKSQRDLEDRYKRLLQSQLAAPELIDAMPPEFKARRMRQLQSRLNEVRAAKKSEQAAALAAGRRFDADDFEVPIRIPSQAQLEKKSKKSAPGSSAAASSASSAAASASCSATSPTTDEFSSFSAILKAADGKSQKVREERAARRLKAAGVPGDGLLRWYRLTLQVNLNRGDARMPKKTSELSSSLNDLMLELFPDSEPLRQATAAATAPMPDYLPPSLSLDGLLKCSAHHHHDAAEKEAEEEEKKEEVASAAAAARAAAARAAPVDPLHMNAEELSAAAQLVPTCVLKDYQVQTVRWMLRAESSQCNVSQPFWVELQMEDGCRFLYSPTLQRFSFTSLPDVHGGFVCEEMGLGKTIEALALLNLQAKRDADSAQREAQAAQAAAGAAAAGSPAAAACAAAAAPVRDANGAYVSRATLIICPVSLISQWVAELREKSTRPLRILSYHGNRPKDPRALLDYDVVLTAYSILSVESSQISARAASAAIDSPWSFEGPSGLSYTSPLSQVHWRRVVLDEGHSVKNAGAECSQQAGRLLGRCRWLMSGTPFGTSLMDARGQTKFLAAAGLAGSFLFTELQRFMQSQGRYKDLAAKLKSDECDGVAYRTAQWLCRFRNIFTTLCRHVMMRHEKGMLFRGRATLLVLPEARVEVIRVELTPTQRAAYKLLFEFATKRFEAFKASGDAVRKTIEVLQLLVPLRQACSMDTVDVGVIRQQLRDLARGLVVGGPALGGASAACDSFPAATEPAYGSLADECTICLELLEEALQTQCRHLFCKECILALCDNKGADACCPNCRSSISPARLCAPLVLPSPEELERQDAEAAQRKEAEAVAAAEAAERKEADGDVAMAAAADDDDDDAPLRKPPAKRRRRNVGSDDEEERKSADEADADGEEAAAAAAQVKEEEVEVEGEIVFDSKLKALLAELRAMKEKDPSAKALVFTQFRGTMDRIQRALAEADIQFQMLLGHYSLAQRKKALEKFKSDPDTTVFLLSVRAAAAGLTLTSASYVFIVEPGFNPAITLQAINRVWRIGQTKQVNVRYLICADTVEETILTIAREKMNQRGANDDGAENSGLALLPELAGSSAASSGKAAAAAAAAPAAPGSDSEEEDAPAAGRRGRGRNGRMRDRDRESGRGVTMGHATNDALPDLRLGELERLFAV